MGASLLENELLQYWPKLTIVQQEAEIDIEQYNRDIDEAMKRINEGKFITQENLENESEQW